MDLPAASVLLKQTWAVSGVLLFNLGYGMMNARATVEPIRIEPDSQITWIGPLFITLGLLSSALIMHWIGRRAAFIVSIFAFTISCCTVYFTTSIALTTTGQIFRDFAGSGVILGAMAIGEYSSPIYRGVFLTLTSASLELGRMIAYFIRDFKNIAMLALVLSVLSFVMVCTWHETPHFLAWRYKYDDCTRSFLKLRGTSFSERQELAKLIQKGKEAESKFIKKRGMIVILSDTVKKLTTIKFLKPVVVILFASILLEASGKTIFDAYGSQIASEIFGKYSSFCILAVHIIAAISMILSSILIKVLTRRTLLFSTGSTSVILLFVISLIVFPISTFLTSFTAVVLLALLLFLMLTNLSCSTLFLIWCSELYMLEHKSVGLVVSGLIFKINSYLCLNITTYLINGLKLYGLFGLLTVLMTIALLTLYFIAPETHDKTLLQIEGYFENGDFETEDDELGIEKDIFFV